MRILTDRTIHKFNPTTIFFPLFQQYHLVNIVPCQPVRCSDYQTFYLSSRNSVSQTVQTRPVQAGATAAVIPEDIILWQIPPLLADIAHQTLQLLFNGLSLGLSQGRDSGINSYSHVAPPGWSSVFGLFRRFELSPGLRDRLDPIGSVRLDILVLPDEFSTVVSWLPPHSDFSDAEYIFFSMEEVRNRNGRRQWFSRN